jgi:hypothetical protein
MDIARILHETKDAYPRAWDHAHHDGDPERYDWIILATKRLWVESGGTVGGNWRRGVHGDLSMDGISVLVGDQWRFADVIVGAGGSNPRIVYGTPGPEAALRNSAGEYVGAAGVADPSGLRTHFDYALPTGPSGGNNNSGSGLPVPVLTACSFAATDLAGVYQLLQTIAAALAEMKVDAKAASVNAQDAADSASDAAVDAAAIRERMEQQGAVKFPDYEARILGASVTLRPKP